MWFKAVPDKTTCFHFRVKSHPIVKKNEIHSCLWLNLFLVDWVLYSLFQEWQPRLCFKMSLWPPFVMTTLLWSPWKYIFVSASCYNQYVMLNFCSCNLTDLPANSPIWKPPLLSYKNLNLLHVQCWSIEPTFRESQCTRITKVYFD